MNNELTPKNFHEQILGHITGPKFPEIFEKFSEKEIEQILSEQINQLIDKDFSQLIHILYRIDVSEEKLKTALQNEDKTATSGTTIAKLIIQRQLQKIKFRKEFGEKK